MPVPAELRLRQVAGGSASVRADRWWRRLTGHGSETVPAVDLYGGDHWSIAKTLPDVARANGFEARLWVSSAGYGLVPADAKIRAYSATFATGQPDSVLASSADSVIASDFARGW